MKYAVFFEDNPTSGMDVRKQHMAEHLQFLESNSGKVLAAGPLSETCGGQAGGLWVVEANEHSEVQQMIEDDLLWAVGLRKSVRLFDLRGCAM